MRGKDYRLAFKAVAQLRRLNDPSLLAVISGYKPKDQQREFQYFVARIVLARGLTGLSEHWKEMLDPEWRAKLISDIQLLDPREDDDGLIELLITALNDSDDQVGGQSVVVLRHPPIQKRLTSGQRAQIAEALVKALTRHNDHPRGLVWLSWYVELLGQTATKSDAAAIALIEDLRAISGEPHRVEYQKLDPDNLPWPSNILAEKKGVRPQMRISYIPTGKMDIAVVETALKRIRSRDL